LILHILKQKNRHNLQILDYRLIFETNTLRSFASYRTPPKYVTDIHNALPTNAIVLVTNRLFSTVQMVRAVSQWIISVTKFRIVLMVLMSVSVPITLYSQVQEALARFVFQKIGIAKI